MKTILLASALLITGTAFAQADPRDAGQPVGSGNTMQPGTTMGERDTHGANMPAAPSAQTGTATGTTTGTTDMSTGSTTGTTGSTMDSATGTTGSTTGTTGTTTDSTMGATGTAAGTTGSGTMMAQGGNMTPPPEQRASYPRCSRTVTDNCVQNESRARDTRRSRR